MARNPVIDEHAEIRGNDTELDDIEYDERGVHIDVDCPNCQYSKTMILAWKEVAAMVKGRPIRGEQMSTRRMRHGGYRIAFRCDTCFENFGDADTRTRNRESTIVVDVAGGEIDNWLLMGRKILSAVRQGRPVGSPPIQPDGQPQPQQQQAQPQRQQRRIVRRRRPGPQPAPRKKGILGKIFGG